MSSSSQIISTSFSSSYSSILPSFDESILLVPFDFASYLNEYPFSLTRMEGDSTMGVSFEYKLSRLSYIFLDEICFSTLAFTTS
jgi:hypothetical protein